MDAGHFAFCMHILDVRFGCTEQQFTFCGSNRMRGFLCLTLEAKMSVNDVTESTTLKMMMKLTAHVVFIL